MYIFINDKMPQVNYHPPVAKKKKKMREHYTVKQ